MLLRILPSSHQTLEAAVPGASSSAGPWSYLGSREAKSKHHTVPTAAKSKNGFVLVLWIFPAEEEQAGSALQLWIPCFPSPHAPQAAWCLYQQQSDVQPAAAHFFNTLPFNLLAVIMAELTHSQLRFIAHVRPSVTSTLLKAGQQRDSPTPQLVLGLCFHENPNFSLWMCAGASQCHCTAPAVARAEDSALLLVPEGAPCAIRKQRDNAIIPWCTFLLALHTRQHHRTPVLARFLNHTQLRTLA